MRQVRRSVMLNASGIRGTTQPPRAFGKRFPAFARDALAFNGPSILVGKPPTLIDAAQTILVEALGKRQHVRMMRVDDLVDSQFERAEKRQLMLTIRSPTIIALVCGLEPPHGYNSKVVARILLERRSTPTILASTNGDLAALYGREVSEAIEGINHMPLFRLA